MNADLDTLCTVVQRTSADLARTLATGKEERPPRITDAEVVSLCVAQAIMGVPSNRRVLAVARKRPVPLCTSSGIDTDYSCIS